MAKNRPIEDIDPLVQAFPDPAAPDGRLVEVRLLNGYVPLHAEPEGGEIFRKVPAGEVIRIPQDEASGLIEASRATVTRNTFGG